MYSKKSYISRQFTDMDLLRGQSDWLAADQIPGRFEHQLGADEGEQGGDQPLGVD